MGTHKDKTDALHASLAGKPYSVLVMDFLRERGSQVGDDLLIGEFNLEVFAEMVHTIAFEQGYEAGRDVSGQHADERTEELESELEDAKLALKTAQEVIREDYESRIEAYKAETRERAEEVAKAKQVIDALQKEITRIEDEELVYKGIAQERERVIKSLRFDIGELRRNTERRVLNSYKEGTVDGGTIIVRVMEASER